MEDIVTIASILAGMLLVGILWRLAERADKAEIEALSQPAAPEQLCSPEEGLVPQATPAE
jgi:hypothetical protein